VSVGPVRFEGQDVPRDATVVERVNVAWPDFAPLAELRDLQVLRLTHTNPHRSPGGLPVDLQPLAAVDGLEVLVLRHYPIRDLGPLRNLRRLQVLDLSFAPVADLAPLAGLGSLRDLGLRATRVVSLEPLEGLARLERLDVGHTPVADVRPLHGLPALHEVELDGTAVPPDAYAALLAARPATAITPP
jgi:internalin A